MTRDRMQRTESSVRSFCVQHVSIDNLDFAWKDVRCYNNEKSTTYQRFAARVRLPCHLLHRKESRYLTCGTIDVSRTNKYFRFRSGPSPSAILPPRMSVQRAHRER